jgi:transposase
LGNPANLRLTPGQDHDLAGAAALLENADPGALIGDKAYDADALIDTLKQRAITPVIPPRANRKAPRECDFVLYRERNLVERFFNKIKHFRAIATRYDKLARNFLAAVQLISAMVLLNSRQALVDRDHRPRCAGLLARGLAKRSPPVACPDRVAAGRRPWPRAQPAVQSAAPVPSLVLAAIPHCRSATWPAFARPCPAAWAVGTFHTRLLAKEPQGYFVFPSHHQSP